MKQSGLIVAKQNKTENHANKSSCVLLSSGKIQLWLELAWPEDCPRPRESERSTGRGGGLGWRTELPGSRGSLQTALHTFPPPAANESSMLGKEACLVLGRGWGCLPRLCRDGRPTAAYTSWTRTPSFLCSEAAGALGRSWRRLRAAECGERIRVWVPLWLLQLNVSISCPWTVSCWHGIAEHYLQSCRLRLEGNEHGNPWCLYVPKATLVNERARQTAGSCVPTFLLLVGESCAAISVTSASWPLPTFSVHTDAARSWAKEEASAVLRGCAARSASVVGPAAKTQQGRARGSPARAAERGNKEACPQQRPAVQCQAGRELQEWLHPLKDGKLRPGGDVTYLGSGQAGSPEGPSTLLVDF